jgi:hypothetical protein
VPIDVGPCSGFSRDPPKDKNTAWKKCWGCRKLAEKRWTIELFGRIFVPFLIYILPFFSDRKVREKGAGRGIWGAGSPELSGGDGTGI